MRIYENLRAEIPGKVVEMEQKLAAWELNRDRCDIDKARLDPYRIPKSSE